MQLSDCWASKDLFCGFERRLDSLLLKISYSLSELALCHRLFQLPYYWVIFAIILLATESECGTIEISIEHDQINFILRLDDPFTLLENHLFISFSNFKITSSLLTSYDVQTYPRIVSKIVPLHGVFVQSYFYLILENSVSSIPIRSSLVVRVLYWLSLSDNFIFKMF